MNNNRSIKTKIKKLEKMNKKKINTSFLSKTLVLIILTLISLIVLKKNPKLKTGFYNTIYDKHISFASISKWYEKHFGSSIPFKEILSSKTKTVFEEKIEYSKKEDYKDGLKLTVNQNYSIPALESGMVVYIGKKESYGNVVIIQQTDGTDVWYGNVTTNLKMYDYIEKGKFIGNTEDKTLYLVFLKNGKKVKYEKYL